MQYTSSGKIAFKWIGRAAGTVGIAASVLLTGGWAAVVIVGGAAIETSAEITNNYAPLWPDSG